MRPVDGQREIDSIFALEYYSADTLFIFCISWYRDQINQV